MIDIHLILLESKLIKELSKNEWVRSNIKNDTNFDDDLFFIFEKGSIENMTIPYLTRIDSGFRKKIIKLDSIYIDNLEIERLGKVKIKPNCIYKKENNCFTVKDCFGFDIPVNYSGMKHTCNDLSKNKEK